MSRGKHHKLNEALFVWYHQEVEPKSSQVFVDDSRISYWTAGNPKSPPLIFFHGWPGIKLLESGVVQEFSKYFFVIAPQHPGLASSDPLSSYTNIFEQNAKVGFKILKREKMLGKKVIVVGQSFGGAVASAFSYTYPQNTKQLVLVDSILGVEKWNPWINFWFLVGPKLVKLLPYFPNPLKMFALKQAFAATPNEHLSWTRLVNSIPRRIEMVQNYAEIIGRSRQSGIAVIDKKYADFPILVVWGDKDGKEFNFHGSIPVDDAKKVIESLKKKDNKVTFVTVSGGHTVLYKKPEYVIGEIRKHFQI